MAAVFFQRNVKCHLTAPRLVTIIIVLRRLDRIRHQRRANAENSDDHQYCAANQSHLHVEIPTQDANYQRNQYKYFRPSDYRARTRLACNFRFVFVAHSAHLTTELSGGLSRGACKD